MRKKQKQGSRYRFGMLGLFLIGIAFVGCEAEKDFLEESDNGKQMRRDITFEQFKKEIGQPKFSTKFSLSGSDLARSMEDFEIDTTNVKALETNFIVYSMKLEPKFVPEVYKFYNLLVYKDNGDEIVKQIMEFKPTTEIIGETEQEKYNYLQAASKQIIYSTKESNLTTFCVKTEIDMVCRCYGHTVFECNGCSLGWTWRIRVITVPCTNGGEGGGPGNGSNPGSPIGGSPSDGGGGGPSSTINNENAIIASPVVPGLDGVSAAIKNPCAKLKKFNTNNTIQQTLRILKEQSSGQAEHGNYISETTNTAGATYLSFPVIPQDSNNPYAININAGLSTGKVKGAMHCHTDPATTTMFPMFSAADLDILYQIADKHVPANNAVKDYTEYTVMLSVGSGHYALKLKNFSGDYYNLNHNILDFKKDLEEENKKIGHLASSNDLIKVFLKNLNEYFGNEVALYKATEGTDSNGLPVVTGWKEQTLNENNDILEINCP